MLNMEQQLQLQDHTVRPAVSCRLPTAAAMVRSQFQSCPTCGGQCRNGTLCLPVLLFPLAILTPPHAPWSSMSTTQCNNFKENFNYRTAEGKMLTRNCTLVRGAANGIRLMHVSLKVLSSTRFKGSTKHEYTASTLGTRMRHRPLRYL
jgi:hypothetical protein